MSIAESAHVHPSAIVDEGARIAEDVRVGPFSVIGPNVVLERGVEIKSHSVVTGQTRIGEETVIFPFCVIGEIPQDLKFSGEETSLEIGARNRIREHVTMNTGTAGGGGVTRIGDDCLLMASVHIAHDCQVGDRVVFVNNSGLAGHCIVENDVIVGGLSGVHQWVRVGSGAIIGAVTMVGRDVIPYGMVRGPRGRLEGLNLVGLKRKGLNREDISELRSAFEQLSSGQGSFQDRAQHLKESKPNKYVDEIVEFVTGASDRSFLTPGHGS